MTNPDAQKDVEPHALLLQGGRPDAHSLQSHAGAASTESQTM